MTKNKLAILLLTAFSIFALFYFARKALPPGGGSVEKIDLTTRGETGTETYSNVKVMAHYMPWFKRQITDSGDTDWSHWQWYGKGKKHDPDDILENGRHDIASVYYPLIAPYDSHDPDVIEYHIVTAKLAGIEAFMCNWYGPNSFTDKAVAAMLPIAQKYDFKIGICLEEKAIYPPYSNCENRQQLVAELRRHIEHILIQYTDSPALLKHDGRALLFIFNSFGDGPLGSNNMSPEEFTQARSMLPKHLLIRNHLDSNHFPAADGPYLWCAEKEAREQRYQTVKDIAAAGGASYFSASASPGFDDSGVNGWGNIIRKTGRRGVEEYSDTWQQAIEADLDSVQIVTWNDFQEGTPIEPTVEFEFQFIDQTELHIGSLTGRSSNLDDNDLGLALFKLRKAAQTDNNNRNQWADQIDTIAAGLFDTEAGSTRTQIDNLMSRISSEATGPKQ